MKIGTAVLVYLLGVVTNAYGVVSGPGDVPQAIGFYSKGSLSGAAHFAPESDAHSVLFRPRNRSWGTNEIIDLLGKVSAQMHREFPAGERLQVGDIAQREGGPAEGHASHQNGLDVDIAYFRVDRRESDPSKTDGFDESFVVKGRLTPNFDLERNWRLMQVLAANGRINRMFVDPAIKKAFCKRAEARGDTSRATDQLLRRLRPWPLHDNHVHVRIECPAFSPKCESQEAPPEGNGCQEIEKGPQGGSSQALSVD